MTVLVLLGLLLLAFLLAKVVHRMREGLAPRCAPLGESFSDPASCHWSVLDDQQLERFVGDSSS